MHWPGGTLADHCRPAPGAQRRFVDHAGTFALRTTMVHPLAWSAGVWRRVWCSHRYTGSRWPLMAAACCGVTPEASQSARWVRSAMAEPAHVGAAFEDVPRGLGVDAVNGARVAFDFLGQTCGLVVVAHGAADGPLVAGAVHVAFE